MIAITFYKLFTNRPNELRIVFFIPISSPNPSPFFSSLPSFPFRPFPNLNILTVPLVQRFEVTFSMLEIYNEQVRDLLSKDNPKGGLAVRQNPKLGMFYVQNLKKVPVGSYSEIEMRMEQGEINQVQTYFSNRYEKNNTYLP